MKTNLIIVEGLPGSGKSTMVGAFKRWLEDNEIDSVVINRIGHIVRHSLYFIPGIADRNSDSGFPDHAHIVEPVSERNRLISRKSIVFTHLADSDGLVCFDRVYIKDNLMRFDYGFVWCNFDWIKTRLITINQRNARGY